MLTYRREKKKDNYMDHPHMSKVGVQVAKPRKLEGLTAYLMQNNV